MEKRGNMRKMIVGNAQNERGYALVALLIMLAVSVVVVAGSLKLSSASSRTTYATKVRSTRYYTAESGLGSGLSWLRSESQNLVSPYTRENFYDNFDLTSPTVGDNDVEQFGVPTKLKLKGTNNSAILSSDVLLASAAFPATEHITSGVAFDAITAFANANLGLGKVRVTLIDAAPLDPAKDYGPPPNPAPTTDFYPIYRIDAVSENDRGARVYGYVTGSLYYTDTIGFYGRDFADVRQDCKSFPFVNATVNTSAINAKCPVGSNALISMQNNAEIYGSARSNGSINNSVGHVCADFTPGCPNSGTTCSGAACNVPGLPTIDPWATHCSAGNLGAVNVPANGNVTLTAGSDPTQHCWTSITIQNKGKLTLTTTTSPYWFQSLDIVGGNAQTQLIVSPSPAGGTVRLYIDTVVGDHVNGNQAVNPNSRPSQFRLYYLGTNDLVLNGNSKMGMAVVAPNAGIIIQGSSDFNGGAIAQDLTLTGSANIYYDETLGGSTLNDVYYKLRQAVEYYN